MESILVFNCFPCAYLFFVQQVGTVARLLEAGGWRPAAAAEFQAAVAAVAAAVVELVVGYDAIVTNDLAAIYRRFRHIHANL